MSRDSSVPAPVSDEAFEAVLAELRAEYGGVLPAKIDELAAALAALRSAPDDAAALSQARGIAHRLGGTAGSYGFFEVGRAIARIEELLTVTHPGEDLPRGGWAGVDALIDEARGAVKL